MSLTRFSVDHKAVVYTAVLILLVGGLLTFKSMSRREDPEILIRNAVVTTSWPGAPARKIEELITDPLEKKILEMSELKKVETDSLVGQSIIIIELEDEYTDLDLIWEKLRYKVAEVKLPEGVKPPYINSEFGDVFSVVLALRQAPGSKETRYTYRELEVIAEQVQDALLALDSTAKVQFYGNQPEEITLNVDAGEWSQIGLSSQTLGKVLDARNIIEPGGSVDTEQGRYSVIPSGDFTDLSQIQNVFLAGTEERLPVRLSDLPIEVQRGYIDPAVRVARFRTSDEQPDRTILITVSMKTGRNIVEMGKAIDGCLALLQKGVLPPDIKITKVNDLPRQVSTLVSDFVTNLWQAIVIVLAVAALMMGWRPAVVMALAIPLSMIATIFIVEKVGVELEQFSIASLIIALGMVVDNAIVISDNVVRLLGEGKSKREAAIEGANELSVPVLASTLTTVAAFLPLAFMTGSTGEYVKSLPIVVSVTLLASYAVAMCVTPLMCMGILRPPENVGQEEAPSAMGIAYEKVVHACMNRKAITLGVAFAALVGSLQLIPIIGSQFFPAGDRDQFFIDVWLPEGSPLTATDGVVKQLQEMVHETRMRDVGGEQKDCLANVTGFVGGGPPRLSLTFDTEQTYSNYAILLVNTTNAKASGAWVDELTEKVKNIPGAQITVRRYMLGPVIKYPIEFRLVGPDDKVLREKAEEMMAALRDTPGAARVWNNWGNSGYQVSVEIDSEAANLAGVSNRAVARTLNALLSGGYLTTYREGDHQVRLVLRLRSEERAALGDVSGIYVNGLNGKVPLDSIAKVDVSWQPAKISRRDNRRCVTVAGRVAVGHLPNTVTQNALPKMQAILKTLPPTYELQIGGEADKSAEGQAKIGGAFKIGFALIVLVLISQFNSFAKPLVILMAVPLALIGALLGLLVSGWALGFMPLLGIVSLAGIVINNAIVLIDFIESKVADGDELRPAVAAAGQVRMKPIILTTLTTVGGMLPLALFAGPMWAGMAWAVILGLCFSTVLTLLVVPTLFVTLVDGLNLEVGGVDLRERAASAAPATASAAVPPPSSASVPPPSSASVPKPVEEPTPEPPKAEEPKAEVPKAEPKAEEPKAEPKAEEPKAEPKAEEPKAEPKAEEPKPEPKAEEGEPPTGEDKP